MQGDIVREITHYCNISVDFCTRIPNQTINFYDFTFVLKGSITYYANGKKLVVEKDDAIFLPPGTLRSREQGNAPVRYVSFNFIVDAKYVLPFDIHVKKCINSDIKKLISVFPFSHLPAGFHSKEKCRNILNYILLELIDIQHLNCKNNHVILILKYISEHITEKITLQSLANYLYLSKEYISYIFSKETGVQLMYYINEQKSLLAKSLILNDGMPPSKVWRYLGFESYDYFSKTFKKYIGTPPSYLKNNSQIK